MQDCLFCKMAAGDIPVSKGMKMTPCLRFMISIRRHRCIFS